MNNSTFQHAVKLIQHSRHLVVVTGAGISTDSGIPSFRGNSGLWKQFDPEKYASIQGFLENPDQSWHFFLYLLELFSNAKPNKSHHLIAAMEKQSIVKHVITQNIDGLHQLAGTRKIIEIHGNISNLICLNCGHRITGKGMIFDTEDLPPMCICGGVFKPDTILFGEPIPSARYFSSLEQIRLADVLLLVGTSGVVHPVNEFPEIALRHGAKLIEINPEESLMTRIHDTTHLKGNSIEILDRLCKAISMRRD